MPDAAILCGGLGTRLRHAVPGVPKGLAPVGGRAFLDRLIEDLPVVLFPRVVLCTGVGAEQMRRHYAGNGRIVFSQEPEPLGTGGALGLAAAQLRGNAIVAMNGDSLVPGLDWEAFVAGGSAAMVLVPADERSDAGVHAVDENGRVAAGSGTHSAGIYYLPAAWLAEIPAGRAVSLERELMPVWIERGMRAFVHAGELIDIGTPERWAAAQERLG